MNAQHKHTLQELVERFGKNIGSGNYKELFGLARSVADILQDSSIRDEVDRREANYFYMLRFLVGGTAPVNAAEMEKLNTFFRSLHCLFAAALEKNDAASQRGARYRYEDLRPEENIESLFSDFLAELSRVRTDLSALTDSSANKKLEQIATDIFLRLWVLPVLKNDVEALVREMLFDTDIPQVYRLFWLNAIGLGLIVPPDEARMKLLMDVCAADEERMAVYAAAWLLLACNDISKTWAAPIMEKFVKDNILRFEDLLLSMCLTSTLKESDATNAFSELMQMGRNFRDKFGDKVADLKPEDLMNADLSAEDYEKIKNFTESQLGGEDVFAFTLGKMRHGEFFNSMPCWLMPFTPSHSSLAPLNQGEGAAFIESVSMMNHLCDSDKYALLMSMMAMPPSMRQPALEQMVDSMRAMSDSPEFEQAMEQAARPTRRNIVADCVQNIFRFFNFLPGHEAFGNRLAVFANNYPEKFGAEVVNEQVYLTLGDKCFAKKDFSNAAKHYSMLDHAAIDNVELLERIIVAYIGSGDKNRSAQIESLCELVLSLDPENKQALLRIARMRKAASLPLVDMLKPYCTQFGDDAGFLKIYAEACIAEKDYVTALDILHKLDYMLPAEDKDVKSLLPWMHLLNGNFDEAVILYETNERDGDSAQIEKLRYGVALWLAGQRSSAVQVFSLAHRTPFSYSSAAVLLHDILEIVKEAVPTFENDATLIPEIIRYNESVSDFGPVV